MANELSISRSKSPLTAYECGVKFTLKTHGCEYDIDGATASKLSDVLLSPGDTKFVKIKTVQGQVVLNVSSIMAVSADERCAISILHYLSKEPFELAKERGLAVTEVFSDDVDKIEWFFVRYRSWANARNIAVAEWDIFEHFFKKAAADVTILKDVPRISYQIRYA